MNYLSHFAVDYRDNDPAFNTGLILPDVTRKWIRRLHPAFPSGNPVFDSFADGCAHHHAADKKFHASALFENLNHRMNQCLSHAQLSDEVERKWFIAHVAVEVLLDRWLVKENPDLCDRFYKSLLAVDRKDLTAFLVANGLSDPAEFMVGFGHFCKVQFIRYYTDNNKLMYSLSRIMMRAGLSEPHKADQEKLLNALLIFEREELNGKGPVMHLLKETVR